jgi:hypothetical protein
MRKALFLLSLVACLNASAQWIDKEGKPLPDTDDRKAVGRFGAEIVFTTDEEALEKRWATPSDTVHVDSVDTVRINQPISAFIVFSGCKATATGKCNVSMIFRVIQPDGKVYATTPDMEVWQDKDAPGSALALSVQYLRIRIEPQESRGLYTVNVEVRDHNSGKVLLLKKPFTAADV